MSAVKQRGVCLVVLLLALATACGKPVAGEPRAAENAVRTTSRTTPPTTSRRPTTPTSPTRTSTSGKPSTSDVFSGLVGTWDGEYTCGQGNTGLKLTIKSPQGDALPA